MAARQSLDPESRAALAELAKKLPEKEVLRVIGDLSPEAYSRALAGLPIQRGTISLIKAGLAERRGAAA